MDLKEFKRKVNIGLLQKGMNRVGLADNLRISYGVLSHYLNGIMDMPEDVRKDIIEILELDEVV